LSAPSAQASVTPLAVTPSDAARLLSIRMSHLYGLMRTGELHSFHCGRARRITVASIHAYIGRRLADSAGGWQQITPQPPRRHGRQQAQERA
jgi:excisionase family DNA binding protein